MGSTNEGADDVEVLESRINRDQSVRKPNPRRRGTVHLHQSSTPSFHHVAVGKYRYIFLYSVVKTTRYYMFVFFLTFFHENGVFCVLFMPWFPSLSFPFLSFAGLGGGYLVEVSRQVSTERERHLHGTVQYSTVQYSRLHDLLPDTGRVMND